MSRLFGRRRQPSIVITEDSITGAAPGSGGGTETIRWDELTEVRVTTTSEGPFTEDVFFVMLAGDRSCIVPQSKASDEFVGRLQELPGFDNRQMAVAMTSTTDAEFVCWRLPGAPAADAASG